MPQNLLTKRIKDWVNTALKTHFVQGNYIPMDGINGTQKIPAEFFSALNNLSISSTDDYLYVVTDNDGIFLFGIKKDGSVDWQKGTPEVLKKEIEGVIEGVLATKVDKETGKSLVDSVFAGGVSFVENSEYSFALVDSLDRFLFGVRVNGGVTWVKGLPDFLQKFIEKAEASAESLSLKVNGEYGLALMDALDRVVLGFKNNGTVESSAIKRLIDERLQGGEAIASKEYVGNAVGAERNRAVDAEQALQRAIDSIEPTTVVGGSNNPDEEYLTSIDDKITFKNFASKIYGYAKKYVRQGDSVSNIFSDPNTVYVIHTVIDLDGNVINIPQNCILFFDGGSIYNGVLNGSSTKILGTDSCFGPSLTFGGTWSVNYISSNLLVNKNDANALKQLVKLSDDNLYNVIHITPGQYVFTPEQNADKLLTLKSNTKLIIDGAISTTPNSYPAYNVVFAGGKSNIEICGNGSISGDVDDHDYSGGGTHEWGHCISAQETVNLEIHGLNINNAAGDGIAAGGTNVAIHDVTIEHCGRQGISIFTSENVDICRCVIDDIFRTAPMAAIDVEPNSGIAANVRIHDIKISNCYGIHLLYTNGAVVENVDAVECSRLLGGAHSSKVFIKNIRYSGELVPFISCATDCSDLFLSDIFAGSSSRIRINYTNITLGLNMRLNSLEDEVSGTPEAGSVAYTNGKFIQFNGSAWVNFDGSALT